MDNTFFANITLPVFNVAAEATAFGILLGSMLLGALIGWRVFKRFTR